MLASRMKDLSFRIFVVDASNLSSFVYALGISVELQGPAVYNEINRIPL